LAVWRGGTAAIVRDHHGSFIAGASHFLPHTFDAEGAELLACRQAALFDREVHVKKLSLEMDNQGVGLKLSREDEDHSVHDHLVKEVRSILRSFKELEVRMVRRTSNEAAYLLTNDSCDNKLSRFWFAVPPANIVNRLDLDLSDV
jgi:hypothetical protein